MEGKIRMVTIARFSKISMVISEAARFGATLAAGGEG